MPDYAGDGSISEGSCAIAGDSEAEAPQPKRARVGIAPKIGTLQAYVIYGCADGLWAVADDRNEDIGDDVHRHRDLLVFQIDFINFHFASVSKCSCKTTGTLG